MVNNFIAFDSRREKNNQQVHKKCYKCDFENLNTIKTCIFFVSSYV